MFTPDKDKYFSESYNDSKLVKLCGLGSYFFTVKEKKLILWLPLPVFWGYIYIWAF